MPPTGGVDLVVARSLASCGCLRRGVLAAQGVPDSAVAARLASGEWRVVLGDVIQLGAMPPSVPARMAAVRLLAPLHRFTGDVAMAAWGLLAPAAVGEVVAEVARRCAPLAGDGVRIRRSSATEAQLRAAPVVRGVPVLSEPDTVRERAGTLPPSQADDLVESFLRRHRDGLAALEAALGRGRSGSAALAAALARVGDGHWSKAERLLGSRLRRAGHVLVANARIVRPSTGEPAYVDLFDPTRRRGVEVDGWTYHVARDRFAGDRSRDRWLLMECGVEVLRVAASEVLGDPDQAAREVGAWLLRPSPS